jgi:predicted nucleic acid-binding protein
LVAETHALLLARTNLVFALRMLERIDQGAGVIARVDDDGERRAQEIVATYQDKDFTLVDAMSFAAMDRLGINTAFAFDHHFAQYEFVLAD